MKRIEYKQNQIINGLTFLKEIKQESGLREALFKCYCGKEFSVRIKDVKSGNTKSCGCYKIKNMKKIATTHGLTNHPLYEVWCGMKKRCYNKNSSNYKYYGGRGILIHKNWVNNFKTFYNWAVANGYKKGLTIDRINNNYGYVWFNCRFVTRVINSRNKRTTKLNWDLVTEIRNIKLLIPNIMLKELAPAYNISISTVGKILNNQMWATI